MIICKCVLSAKDITNFGSGLLLLLLDLYSQNLHSLLPILVS